jgi:hypothetical protein
MAIATPSRVPHMETPHHSDPQGHDIEWYKRPVLVAAVEAEVRPFLLVPFIFISSRYLISFRISPHFNYILLSVIDDTTSAKYTQYERNTQQSN